MKVFYGALISCANAVSREIPCSQVSVKYSLSQLNCRTHKP